MKIYPWLISFLSLIIVKAINSKHLKRGSEKIQFRKSVVEIALLPFEFQRRSVPNSQIRLRCTDQGKSMTGIFILNINRNKRLNELISTTDCHFF